ncbi:MAG: SRPBCC family protein [Solirubrobacteraceae bacterium]
MKDDKGRTTLRFERVLGHPIERVWQALIDPAEQDAWHPTPFEIEPLTDGTVRYLSSADAPAMPDGKVLEHEPPHVLAHTWGEDLLRWELHPHQEGCLLVLTHTFDDHLKAARDAAGWHLCLDSMRSSLSNQQTVGEQPSHRGPSQGWRELNSEYEQRFGIPADQATPPPAR